MQWLFVLSLFLRRVLLVGSVIWDEIKDPNLPPEDHWPVLWACEIKYSTGKPSDWDIEKLEYLVSQSRIKFGCWLTLRFQRAVKGSGITWVKNKLGKKKGSVQFCLELAGSKKWKKG